MPLSLRAAALGLSLAYLLATSGDQDSDGSPLA